MEERTIFLEEFDNISWRMVKFWDIRLFGKGSNLAKKYKAFLGRGENLLEEWKAFWRNAKLFGGRQGPLEEENKSLEVGVEAGYINISAAPAILCIIRMSERHVRIQTCKTQNI